MGSCLPRAKLPPRPSIGQTNAAGKHCFIMVTSVGTRLIAPMSIADEQAELVLPCRALRNRHLE
jgi:hypothetical protein